MSRIYILALLTLMLAGCGGADAVNTTQTEYISQVPAEYFRESESKGQVVIETYRSRDYTLSDDAPITKTAYVYLPHGYDPSKRYDIFYLMHGWTMTAGSFFTDCNLVNMLDNMIADWKIKPLVVVCATFDAENRPQSFYRSTEELLVFHNDLRENLIPHIEAKYSTYSSREHRAFGGFSLGAVTTWHQFIYCLDMFRYFLPMSGDCWIMGTYGGRYYPEETARYLEGIAGSNDFFVWEGIGTNDPIFTQTDNQIQAMMRTQTFTPDKLHYGILQDGRHDFIACETYMYHALQLFFGRDK